MADEDYPKVFHTLHGKVTVFADRVMVEGMLGHRVAARDDYTERRLLQMGDAQWTVLLSSRHEQFEAPLAPAKFAGTWIEDLTDLDVSEALERAHGLLQSDLYGLDAEERGSNLKKWRFIGSWTLLVGLVLTGAALGLDYYLGSPPLPIWLALAVFPILVMAGGLASRGRLWVPKKDDGRWSSAEEVVGYSVFGLLWLAVHAPVPPWEMDPRRMWLLALIGAVLGGMLGRLMPKLNRSGSFTLVYATAGALYGIGLFSPIGVVLDFLRPHLGLS